MGRSVVTGRSTVTLSCLLFFLFGIAWACQVPVFRYALERWSPDQYELVVTPGNGGLTKAENEAIDYLDAMRTSEESPLNLFVRIAEVTGKSGGATAALYYPGRHPDLEVAPIWKGELSMENAKGLVDSPTRRELVGRILTGESAVWLVVESGTKEKDEAAVEMLRTHSATAMKELEIPEGVVGQDEIAAGAAIPIDRENILQSDVPLKIEFSHLRLDRKDPGEAILLSMLMNLEDDLGEWEEDPMAFPIFGRGRVLEPLIGKGINEANILEYSGYLCGACSCEVKDQNPGMDLLMAVHWDAAMEGSEVMIEKILPPLEGTAALLAAAPATDTSGAREAGTGQSAAQPETDAPPTGDPPPPEESLESGKVAGAVTEQKPFFSLWLVLAVAALVIVGGSIFIAKKNAS
jgi:hypothetical protein